MDNVIFQYYPMSLNWYLNQWRLWQWFRLWCSGFWHSHHLSNRYQAWDECATSICRWMENRSRVQNVGIHLHDYIVRSQSEQSLPWKAKNLYLSMILITDNKNILALGFWRIRLNSSCESTWRNCAKHCT